MKKKIYYILVFVFCVVSVCFAIKDFNSGLTPAETYADHIIYALFLGDYVVRFALADNKRRFFKDNILDLIAILPFNSAFRAFRLLRFAKLLRLTKLFRVGSASARLLGRASKFLDTNGFKYMLMLTAFVILFASMAMTKFENMSFADALWWSFVTTTTVGYGDLAPATAAGRAIATMLMVFGIGLIGSLTSTITSFFLKEEESGYSSDKIDMVMTMYGSLSDSEKDEIRNRINQ